MQNAWRSLVEYQGYASQTFLQPAGRFSYASQTFLQPAGRFSYTSQSFLPPAGRFGGRHFLFPQVQEALEAPTFCSCGLQEALEAVTKVCCNPQERLGALQKAYCDFVGWFSPVMTALPVLCHYYMSLIISNQLFLKHHLMHFTGLLLNTLTYRKVLFNKETAEWIS